MIRMPDGGRQQLEAWHLVWPAQTLLDICMWFKAANCFERLLEDLVGVGQGRQQGELQQRESKPGRCWPSSRSCSCPSQSFPPHLTPPLRRTGCPCQTGWEGCLYQHWLGRNLIHIIPSLPPWVLSRPQRKGWVKLVFISKHISRLLRLQRILPKLNDDIIVLIGYILACCALSTEKLCGGCPPPILLTRLQCLWGCQV